MNTKPLLRTVILTPLLLLGACTMPIESLPVTVEREAPILSSQGPLIEGALGQVRVTSTMPIFGEMTPMSPDILRRALEEALMGSSLFNGDSRQPVTIDAQVLGSTIPSMDFGGFASSMTVQYNVLAANGQVLMSETVTSQGRDDSGSFLGEIRFKRSMTLAVANNAKNFRDRLRTVMASRVSPSEVPAIASRPVKKGTVATPAPAPLPPTPAPVTTLPAPSQAKPRFAETPVISRFPRGPERPDDIAVIIGNADYTRQGRDIPDVKPAHADAEGARLFATQTLGIKEGNVIFLKDATGSQLTRVFGSEKDHRGQLFDWVKPGKSRVYVYYSGHGAPGSQGSSPYLIPTDSDASRIELNGYPVKQLYDNLGKLPAENVTVVLEACFSGISPAGSVLGKASPVYFEVKAPPVPANLTVISAGAANQMASWEADETSGLFTKYYLKGMAGEADANKDGRVSLDELDRYLKETLTYYARRHYGRDQNAQIVKGGGS